jgi:tryptophan synthase alpha chain
LNKIELLFNELGSSGRSALIPYVMAGHPSESATVEIIKALAEAGASLVELGIPFSDPLADGATIQHASQKALDNGMNTDKAFAIVNKARESTGIPIVVMTYYNIVLSYGLDRFAETAGRAGVSGAIIPDLPPEEAEDWIAAAANSSLATIFLVAPTSPDNRITAAADVSTGFVYCVSLTGVTGGRSALSEGVTEFLRRVRSLTDKPLAVGFGVSTPEQASFLSRLADGVIVGSALVDTIDSAITGRSSQAAAEFVKNMRAGMR